MGTPLLGAHCETPRVAHVTPTRCLGTCCFPGQSNSMALECLEQLLLPRLSLPVVSGPRGEVSPSLPFQPVLAVNLGFGLFSALFQEIPLLIFVVCTQCLQC